MHSHSDNREEYVTIHYTHVLFCDIVIAILCTLKSRPPEIYKSTWSYYYFTKSSAFMMECMNFVTGLRRVAYRCFYPAVPVGQFI